MISKYTLFEKLARWKVDWVKEIDDHEKLGDKIEPVAVLEYVTSFHEQDSYDDTDFYERIMAYEYFEFQMVELAEIDLARFYTAEDLIEEYVELYQETGTYPPPVINEDYEIIDGTHRLNALYEAGLKEVRCFVGYH